MKCHTLEDLICYQDAARMGRYQELTQGRGDCYYFRRYKGVSPFCKKQSKRRLHFIDDECAVCLNNISSVSSAWITWCGHVFHKQCLRRWCYTTQCCGPCPMCRKEMGPLEFLDGIEYVIYPKIENFCDLLEEVPNMIHHFCYDCGSVMGMNPDQCPPCRSWAQV